MSWPGTASTGRPRGPAPRPAWPGAAANQAAAAYAQQQAQQQQQQQQQSQMAAQQAAVRRVSPGQVQGLPGKVAPKAEESTIIVFSIAEQDEIGIRTLVGEYLEEGTNHGRKFYKKNQKIPGHENIDVFLYFWDKRDGEGFSGWWFGNQVGGAQVWSRNKECSPTPPQRGWTIPWDGDVKKELVVMSGAQKKEYDRKQAETRMQSRKMEEQGKMGDAAAAEWEERVQAATARAATAEVDVGEALEAAKAALEGEIDDDVVASAQEQLLAQVQSLAETQRFLAVEGLAAQKAPAALKAEMAALGHRVRKLQGSVKEEQQRLKNAKLIKVKQAEEEEKRMEEEIRERELEGTHSKQLEEMLPSVMEKVDFAEDEVEKVAIAAAPLQIDTADDLRPVMLQAIKETEQRVRTAQAAIGEAKRFITGKVSQVQRFVSTTKKQALEEFTTMQDKLNEATKKLEPYKNVRNDYEQRVQARKLYEELSGKLAGAEIEVEKAAMMTAPLGGDSAEGIKETETALSTAQSVVSQTTRLIDSKLKAYEKSKGPVYDDVKALQDRAKQAQEKLDEVRKTVKETQIRIAADTLLRDVSERVSNAEDELQRMAEAELPFLRGEQKGPDMDALIAEADKVAVKVHTALAEAQTFVAKKLIEVARFTEGPAKAVREEVDMLQKRLEEGRERLQQFKAGTADRKRAHLLQEVEAKVAAGEIEVQRMQEAVNALSSIGIAGEIVSEGLRETVEQANLAERSAQASIVVARKYLLQKTAELKKLVVAGGAGTGSGTEIGKLQTRVNNMQQEIAKLRADTKNAEERIRVKQLLSEVVMRLQAAEAEVDKVASSAVPHTEEQPSAEAVERMEKSTTSAQTKLTATAKLVDVKLKNASGFLKEELAGMRTRISAAERKLAEVIRASREQKERLLASDLIAQAVEKVEKAEAEVQKCAESELPFLKGIEVLAAKDALTAIGECENAAANAQKTITDARTFVVQKLVDTKQFSEGPADTCSKELMSLQKKLDAGAGKLADLKRDTADRKRKTQMQASNEKISGVEGAVQKLSDVMTKFTEDKMMTMAPEDARGVCEEIASTEHEAQTAVSDARKFLALRVQEAKTLTEAQRSAVTQDLSKLQSRLTQCQVELAKLSKQCTEREQRFVAHKLLQEATQSLDKLQLDVESATRVAAPLLAEDKTQFAKALSVQSMVDALQGHMKKTQATPEQLWATITKNKSAKAAELAAFLDKLPELTGNEEACFTEDQSANVFSSIASGDKVTAEQFKALFRNRHVCTVTVPASDAAENGKDISTIEVGEGIEELEQKKVNDGIRVKCILTRDNSTVWVTLSTGEKSNFRQALPMVGGMGSIEAYIAAVNTRCAEAAEYADRKTVEVASVKQGPLMEVKAKLLTLRTKVSQEQSKIEQLKKKIAASKAGVEGQRKEAIQKVQEVKCKAFAEKSVKEATDVVAAAEARANKVIESAKAGGAEKLQKDLSIKQLQELKTAADQALEALVDAKAAVTKSTEAHEAYKGPTRNLLLEARVELTKLSGRASQCEKKLKASTEAVRTAHTAVVKAATQQARKALQAAARKLSSSFDQLFDEVSGGKDQITQAGFSKFVKKLPDAALTEEQVSLIFQEYGPDLKRSGFAKALQEFFSCIKPTAITEKLSIEGSATLRKLEQGEVFEVLEGPSEDAASKVSRVRGRALKDGVTGWVSVRSNHGVTFLKPTEKPFLRVAKETVMHKQFDTASPEVTKLQQDEVLELLEGPREEAVGSEVILKGSVSTDGAVGWITLKDAKGTIFASLSKSLYVCKSTIAMTDNFDIRACKVVRKVDIGEALEMIGGQSEKEDSKIEIKRLQFRAMRDGKEGWVTLKGNQGTVFAEASKTHYIVAKDLDLREGVAKDSTVIRQLKAGEAFEGKEEPQEEKPDAKLGVCTRALSNSKQGWILFTPGPNAPLRPHKG